MIVLKYQKSGSSAFISHKDLLRHVSRILRRANIPVNFSQGFNPHSLIYFSPPLVLGVSSTAEYLSIDTNLEASEVLKRYNDAVPKGLEASRVFTCEKNPNLQAIVVAGDYIFPTTQHNINAKNSGLSVESGDINADCGNLDCDNDNLDEYFCSKLYDDGKFQTEYLKKGEKIVENVEDKIFEVGNSDGKLRMRLALGNVTLRPDRILSSLNQKLDENMCLTDVVKVAQYVMVDGVLVDVDDYLDGLKKNLK